MPSAGHSMPSRGRGAGMGPYRGTNAVEAIRATRSQKAIRGKQRRVAERSEHILVIAKTFGQCSKIWVVAYLERSVPSAGQKTPQQTCSPRIKKAGRLNYPFLKRKCTRLRKTGEHTIETCCCNILSNMQCRNAIEHVPSNTQSGILSSMPLPKWYDGIALNMRSIYLEEEK